MNKLTIWHNTRCKKSREGLTVAEKIAKKNKIELIIRKYLEDSPNEEELKSVIKMLHIKPIELVRVKEIIWKENFKGKELSDDETISAMVKYPKLIERPIVIYNAKAVLARPAEKIEELF